MPAVKQQRKREEHPGLVMNLRLDAEHPAKLQPSDIVACVDTKTQARYLGLVTLATPKGVRLWTPFHSINVEPNTFFPVENMKRSPNGQWEVILP